MECPRGCCGGVGGNSFGRELGMVNDDYVLFVADEDGHDCVSRHVVDDKIVVVIVVIVLVFGVALWILTSVPDVM